MNNKLLSFSAAAAIGLIILSGCSPKKKTAVITTPVIAFEHTTYNFGKVQQGTMVTYKFKFKNAGTKELVIKSVHPECGCTAALLSSKEILPGGKGVITANFDSTNYIGNVVKTINVATNDPSKQIVILTLKGKIISDIVANPSILFVGSVKEGRQKQLTLNIFVSNPSVKITSVTASKPYIKISSVSRTASQNLYTVTILPNAPLGNLNANIAVLSNSTKEPVIRIPVIGNIVGNILVNPNIVELGVIKIGVKPQTINVYVYTKPVKAFRITKVLIKPDVLKLKVIKQGAGSYKLKIGLKRTKTPGRLSGNIVLSTTMKTMPVVSIPFNGVVIK